MLNAILKGTKRPYFFLIFLFLAASLTGEYDPPAIYLTWQHSPQTTMTVQWITNNDRHEDLVEYQRVGENEWKRVMGFHRPMPEKYPFLIHHAEIIGLLPDTDYRFRTSPDALSYKFRTMPEKLTKPIRFVVGGDIYHDGIEILEKMNRQVAHLNPMFVIAGGDLAYNDTSSSTMPKVMPRWMDLLISWKKQLVTPEGRLIPILPVIGNHDVKGKFGKTPAEAPFFYSLFAMPGIQGYNVLDFGDYMSIVLLDSGHTHPIPGLQAKWLQSALEQRQSIPHKFAVYHVAAFPSVRDFDGKCKPEIRKSWVPLFEQYGVSAVFEHHDHAYKRTHPLLNGKVNPKGVLYIGDGAWGVEEPRKPKSPSKVWYLARTISSRNVVLVTIHDNIHHFFAFDEKGNIIDEFINKK